MTLLNNLQDTEKLAGEIAEKVKNGGLILLSGNLGSGKTTFTQLLAKKLGLNDFSIKSPTYTYIREHKLPERKFYHLDLYRINDQDLINQEVRELMENTRDVIVIEWSEKLNFTINRPKIEILLEYIDPTTRKATINETL